MKILNASLSALNKPLFGSRSNLSPVAQEELSIFEDIDRHLSALHHRNAQLRNAILSGSEQRVRRRLDQFRSVLASYIKLIVTKLHGSISSHATPERIAEYSDIRVETFAGYEKLLEVCNIAPEEMLALGTNFTRQLFQVEMKLKKYYQLEKQIVYPLYNEVLNAGHPISGNTSQL